MRQTAQVRRWATARLRAATELGEGVVEAYASVFGVEYPIFLGVLERIEPGAFAASLAARPVLPIFWEHDWDDAPIGVTAEATEDDHGLRVVGELFLEDSDKARRIYRTLRAGGLGEWSIGYWPEVWRIEEDENTGREVEVIEQARLGEASLVVRGANPSTETVEVRRLRSRIEGELGRPADDRTIARRLRELEGTLAPAPAGLAIVDDGVRMPWGETVSIERLRRVARPDDFDRLSRSSRPVR